MDHPTPPTAALRNLTITTSLSPPTTALENLTISGTNTEKNKPRKVNHIKASRTLPGRGDSFRPQSHLIALIRQWYGPSWTSRSAIRLEDSSPRPSNVVSPEERMNQLRLHASKLWWNREKFNSVRLSFIRRRIIGKLNNMAENKPEHREELKLAQSYVQQRDNKDEVFRIIKSVYTSY